jgi:AcrR family transcriptional regulator
VTHGWERNKARTRLALATAAARLFREQGYAATTVEDIARAAGSSSSTFFRYFGAKEDVLFFNIREVLDIFRDFLAQPVPGLSCWDQVHVGVINAVRQVAEPSTEIEEASITGWLTEPAISRRFGEFSRELEQVITVALARERGVDADRDLTVQLAARSATAAYMAAFHVHIHTGIDLPELLDQAFRAIEERPRTAIPNPDRQACGAEEISH